MKQISKMEKWIAHGKECSEADVHIICFPFAGGTASNYACWKNFFPESYAVCPVLYPGRERRAAEQMPENLEMLAEAFVRENESLFERPFVLFGQCTGATVAYEVVREIRKQYNKAPILFVASGAVSPRTPAISGIGRMTDEELIKFLLDSGRITEEALRIPMFMEYYFPVMKADFAMLEKYKYPGDFMLPCPILTIKGDKDMLATEEEFEKWREYAPKGNFHLEVEGEHYFLDSQMETICSAITKYVKEILNVN